MLNKNGSTPTKPGQPIPFPSDFPIAWTHPQDSHKLWQLDPMHYPDPMAPLEFDLMQAIYARGMDVAAQVYDLPVRIEAQRINTYLYGAFTPQGAPPTGVVRLINQVRRVLPGLIKAIEGKAIGAMTQRYLAKMEPVIARLEAYWQSELLPEVQEYLTSWQAFDLNTASPADLVCHWQMTLTQAKRAGDIHFLIAFPALLAMSRFDDLYRNLFPEAAPFDSYQLLQGFDNKTLAGDRALWQLSRKAQTMPEVQHILENVSVSETISALENSTAGQIFLSEFRTYLAEYGQRGDKFSTIAEVSWLEDPTPAIKSLKDYIQLPNRDMQADLAAEAAERERLVAATREQLADQPPAVREKFDTALKAAQAGIIIHADHGYWIDYCVLYQVRQVVLAVGRRLAGAGMVECDSDIFYLTLPELQTATAALGQDKSLASMHDVIIERKAEVSHFRTSQPPALLGTMPLMPPPDEPFTRMITKFDGTGSGKAGKLDKAELIKGNGGSPGIVRGPAKVVHSIHQASKLESGDILIAETTAAPWTPLFATVAAIVTDTGGILSHCAVVAREYHIPAVVGTGTATQTITDGQLIEVDGEAGTVRLIMSR